MSHYTLKAYEDKLNHQVIHMDQAVCYCPEFRATGMMHDYPSRKLQWARAIYKNEIVADDYIADIIFQSILSRQGERWQNFGECSEDLTDVMILSREMLLEKGYGKRIVEKFKKSLTVNNGHILKMEEAVIKRWQKAIPTTRESHNYLLIDDATAVYATHSAECVGHFFKHKGITFSENIQPIFVGWEYFAYGLVDEGTEYLKQLFKTLEEQGIELIYTLSGQATYLMQEYASKLGLVVPFRVVNLMDELRALKVERPSYFYAGSFNIRYLDKSAVINGLAINDTEELLLNCQEFTPLLQADKRVNVLNIWQKPLGAEYYLWGIEEEIVQAIKTDALRDIKISGAQQIIVFEPYAYAILCDALPEYKVVYYLDRL